jgi:hypothetical protein
VSPNQCESRVRSPEFRAQRLQAKPQEKFRHVQESTRAHDFPSSAPLLPPPFSPSLLSTSSSKGGSACPLLPLGHHRFNCACPRDALHCRSLRRQFHPLSRSGSIYPESRHLLERILKSNAPLSRAVIPAPGLPTIPLVSAAPWSRPPFAHALPIPGTASYITRSLHVSLCTDSLPESCLPPSPAIRVSVPPAGPPPPLPRPPDGSFPHCHPLLRTSCWASIIPRCL